MISEETFENRRDFQVSVSLKICEEVNKGIGRLLSVLPR